jgi:hypothetical protein
MGLSLGLIGGGGQHPHGTDPGVPLHGGAVLATAYSLFIVGLTSLVGSFSHMRMGNIHWRTAIVFGIPSILSRVRHPGLVGARLPDPIVQHRRHVVLSKAVGILIPLRPDHGGGGLQHDPQAEGTRKDRMLPAELRRP